MGEIKGTILAMIMAVGVFALVGGAIYSSFETNATKVESQLNAELSFMD